MIFLQLVLLNAFSALIELKSICTISSTLPAKLCIYSIKRIQHCQPRQKTKLLRPECTAERIQTSVPAQVKILDVNHKATHHRRRQKIKSFSNVLALVQGPVILALITLENVSTICSIHKNCLHCISVFLGSQGSQSSLNNSPKRSQPLKKEESAEEHPTFEAVVNLKR